MTQWQGWLDACPTWLRDLLVAAVTAILGWAGTDAVPALSGKGPAGALAATVLVIAVNALTPLTRRYGLGRVEVTQTPQTPPN